MTPSVSFQCGGCNARIKAPRQLRGQLRSCPGCGHRFVVPSGSPRDEGPILVPDDPPTLHASRPQRVAAFSGRRAG